MLKFAFLLYITIQLTLSSPISDDLVINLPDGQVQGTTFVTNNNKAYYGFLGMPYATPPLGNLRFESPQPGKPWDGIWDATQESKSCLSVSNQQNPDGESEDCLYINVYTPALTPNVQLPVMFWIYGGSFIAGSSSKGTYGPDFLIEEDVIVVTFNYRLVPFGFLSTADAGIRGNAGLKDQSMALKWTHDNIAYFGGDPGKITIFGQSAGGASIALQVLSSKSAGLFNAAIIESGSALTSWAIDKDPKSYADALADALSGGIYKNDSQKFKEFLQEKSAEEIISATISLNYNGQQPWPVIEVEDEDAFISESPYELAASGRFNQVPLIIGICSEESLIYLRDLDTTGQIALLFDSNPSLLIPPDLRQNPSDDDAVVKAIKDTYLNEGETFSNNFVALAEYYSDNNFTRGIIKQAELSSYYVPVYLYQFAYYGRVLNQAFIDGAGKAAHAAELPFIFHWNGVSDTTDSADVLTQNRMTKLWTNFATFLNPTPEPTELLNYVTWSTISPGNLQFLNINDTLEFRSNLRGNSYPGWNNIYETYGEKPFITY